MTKHKGPHKYKRVRLDWGTREGNSFKRTKKFVFRCMLVNCTHFLRKEMVIGQQSLCWYCGDIFTVSPSAARLQKPHCPSCGKGNKQVVTPQGMDAVMQQLHREGGQ